MNTTFIKIINMKQILRNVSLLVLIVISSVTVYGQVSKVDAIGITVRDMNTSLQFYTEVLGFKKISDSEFAGAEYEKLAGLFGLRIRVARLQLGDEIIELTDYLTAGGRSISEDARSNDLSFQHIAIVVSDMDKAYRQLRKSKVTFISTAPQTLPLSNTAAAGIKAFYFLDPDRHNLELIYFPAGKGQPKWQINQNKVFLGIDHTAIGISNTESSLHFYSGLLGFERKGESFNNGTEQEHLNNVEGASLHITGLRTLKGPGIEFLQYLKPGTGRSYPADTRADDIWYWQTVIVVADVESLYRKLKNTSSVFVSPTPIELKNSNGLIIKAFVVRDPDGHAVMVRS
jgi:catechol 2,3-dioxygenase-like lactoylglutathione lyase family enzyme